MQEFMDPVTVLVGAIVSVVVMLVKKYAGTDGLKTGISLVVLSLVGGISLLLLKNYGVWDASLQVLVYAGSVYGLLIKNIQEALV